MPSTNSCLQFVLFRACSDEIAEMYDTETLLTRMLLRGMIEFLTSSSQLDSLAVHEESAAAVEAEAAGQYQLAMMAANATHLPPTDACYSQLYQ